jgi:hypothetical protein
MILAGLTACSPRPDSERVLVRLPLDSTGGLITKTGVTLDEDVSVDGAGSIRIEATGPTTIRLAEVEPSPVEDARLVYRAHLRTEDLDGRAYLEMWCVFPEHGEFFSRALHQPLAGTNDWVTQETPFVLDKGQSPGVVKLNVVVEGKGTVWVDDVVLAVAR